MLVNDLPIVVVGGVDASGIRGDYSQGLPEELTVSSVGRVGCASRQGGAILNTGTSFGERLLIQISLTSGDIGRDAGHLAASAVAGLAAYFMSLDQYRGQLLVQGSVARNVRDLIKSLAYPRLPNQPAVVWNGIDSAEIYCPVRRDAGSSGCPARNTTSSIFPPPTQTPKRPLNRPPPKTATGTSTTSGSTSSIATDTSTTSSSSSLSSIITTDSSTTSNRESFTLTLTISLGGSTETVTISEISTGGDSVVATNALAGATPLLAAINPTPN